MIPERALTAVRVAAPQERGFTLVEVMISLALTVVVMAMTLPLAHAQKRLWQRQEERREAERAVGGALAWLVRDLQQAGYHAPGPPLRQLEPSALAYVLSRDEGDPAGFSAANRRLVTAWLDGDELKYRIQAPAGTAPEAWESGSTQVLAAGLRAMECRGFDAAGESASEPGAVAVVECALTAATGARLGVQVWVRAGAGARR